MSCLMESFELAYFIFCLTHAVSGALMKINHRFLTGEYTYPRNKTSNYPLKFCNQMWIHMPKYNFKQSRFKHQDLPHQEDQFFLSWFLCLIVAVVQNVDALFGIQVFPEPCESILVGRHVTLCEHTQLVFVLWCPFLHVNVLATDFKDHQS